MIVQSSVIDHKYLTIYFSLHEMLFDSVNV